MELKLDRNKTYGLALEGGGAKGAYQIGAWKALREAGIRFSAVSGTSVGALNGAMIVMDDLEKAENVWNNIHFSQVMDVDDEEMRRLMNRDIPLSELKSTLRSVADIVRNRGFDVTPLRKWVAEVVDADKVCHSDTDFFIVTYSLSDHQELELKASDLDKDELCDMLLASAYLPAFRLEKLGGKYYADGGVQDVVPIHALVENGCKDIIALRIFGFGIEKRFRIPDDVHVTTIGPTVDLGNILNFDAEQSRQNMRLGYFDAQRVLYGLYGSTYYIDRTMSEDAARQQLLEYLGRIPIPPYLNRESEEIDNTRYQTVYSKFEGSVAAPTAGLHFTPELIESMRGRGFGFEEVTLHVGAGTFLPVKDDDAARHPMHTEHFEVRCGTVARLLERWGHITAVGTTSVRTLESLTALAWRIRQEGAPDADRVIGQWELYDIPADYTGREALGDLLGWMEAHGVERLKAATQIMITPLGYEFRIVRNIVTNFHQPKSTLLLLVSAFVGDDWHRIYDYALAHDFRFLSYGDSSVLLRD